jgi:hypothetical protein
VCHLPTPRLQYDYFWANYSPSFSAESLALVLAILYTGAENSTVVDVENSSTILRLYEGIFEILDFASHHARNTAASV